MSDASLAMRGALSLTQLILLFGNGLATTKLVVMSAAVRASELVPCALVARKARISQPRYLSDAALAGPHVGRLA